MRFTSNARSHLRFEQFCRTVRDIRHIRRMRRGVLIGSDARHGIAAFVPRRSLTLTTIIGSADCAAAAAFFSLFSLFLSRFSSFSSRSVRSRPRSPSLRSPSLYRSPYRSESRSRSLRGERGRSPLYPRSNLRSSPAPLESPSSRRFSFHRNPPVDFLGLSRSGDLLRLRSSIV